MTKPIATGLDGTNGTSQFCILTAITSPSIRLKEPTSTARWSRLQLEKVHLWSETVNLMLVAKATTTSKACNTDGSASQCKTAQGIGSHKTTQCINNLVSARLHVLAQPNDSHSENDTTHS